MPRPLPIQPGAVHAIPAPKVGFFAAVVTRVPANPTPEPTVFVYADATPRPSPEACADPGRPERWASAWLGFCTPRPFSSGRWPRVGEVAGFQPADWPVPPRLNRCDPHPRSVFLYTDDGTMRLIANLAEPWPAIETGEIQTASDFERCLAQHVKGVKPGFHDMRTVFHRIEAANLDAWRRARAATDDMQRVRGVAPDCPRQIEEGDLLAVPICGGGFGVALVARAEPRPRGGQNLILLGLPVLTDARPADAEAYQHLTQADAVGVWQTNSSGVRYGDWVHLGKLRSFTRADFPLPFLLPLNVPRSPDLRRRLGPIIGSTERWGGRSFVIQRPHKLPDAYLAEANRTLAFSTPALVGDDFGAVLRGVPRSDALNPALDAATLPLWREMADWARRQPDA